MAIEFGDDSTHVLEAGGLARVDAATVRQIRNLSDSEDAVYVAIGGKDGYVGRDGKLPEDESIERLAQDHALSKGREVNQFGDNAPPGA